MYWDEIKEDLPKFHHFNSQEYKNIKPVPLHKDIFSEMVKMRDAYKPEMDIVNFINWVLHNEFKEEY
jgi:hypothetical protein